MAVKVVNRRHVELSRGLRKEMQLLKEMSHDNVCRFVGACVDPPNICIIRQYCSRGSLKVNEPDMNHLNPQSAEICMYKPWRPKGFFHFEIIIGLHILVSSFLIISIPILCVYDQYKCFFTVSVRGPSLDVRI